MVNFNTFLTAVAIGMVIGVAAPIRDNQTQILERFDTLEIAMSNSRWFELMPEQDYVAPPGKHKDTVIVEEK